MPDIYPEIQGGGSLILAWQIKNRNVLVVGGGEVCWVLLSCNMLLTKHRLPLVVSSISSMLTPVSSSYAREKD